MKTIKVDCFTEKCGRCGEPVVYAVGTGVMFYGASESYEEWRTVRHRFCPHCGEKVEEEEECTE